VVRQPLGALSLVDATVAGAGNRSSVPVEYGHAPMTVRLHAEFLADNERAPGSAQTQKRRVMDSALCATYAIAARQTVCAAPDEPTLRRPDNCARQ
jgi:hypothetical protein